MLWLSVTFLALFATVQGRAVNISNTWVLPEEGFPVFYRYFRDRISWYEADAVCQFHHANLVTVDTTAQYDAVRAYLKELDISSAVWVGLIRSNPDGDFTWTDYRGLSGEGYWSAAPDARAAPLCAAADPAADYRWEARACGGPTVASFICELPVPQWALGNDGCMVRALPALTVLYLPESAAVQLTADCGLAGVKRVQCTGNVKREELLKDLSCSDEDDPSNTLNLTSTSTMWPITDTTFTDLTTNDLSTENNFASEYKETSNTATQATETPPPNNLNTISEITTPRKQNLNTKDYIQIPLDKDLEQNQSINILSNDIPLQENSIIDQSLKKNEDSKNYKHRLLHDEMTRLGNLETLFTQPTDHFVPPLVMAKARISDDMTVLTFREKHAQQLAEQRQHEHNIFVKHANIKPSETTTPDINFTTSTTLTPTIIVQKDKFLLQSLQNDSIKKNGKSSAPKKYNDKYNNPKAKIWRTAADYKIQKPENIDIISTMKTLSTSMKVEIPTSKSEIDTQRDSEEDSIIDLTVIIKEPGVNNSQEIFYSNHSNSITKMEVNQNLTEGTEKEIYNKYSTTEIPISTTNPVTVDKKQGSPTATLNHEIIKITVINDQASAENSTPIIFEVSTMLPVSNNNSVKTKDTLSSTMTSEYPSSPINTGKHFTTVSFVSSSTTENPSSSTGTMPTKEEHEVTSVTISPNNYTVKNEENIVSLTKEPVTKQNEVTTEAVTVVSTMIAKTTKEFYTNDTVTVNLPTNLTKVAITEKADFFNHTEHIEEELEQDMIDDYQSPLLSAANEPLHRPNRSRRPQPPPNRMNKFNPFRILG